MHLYLLQPPNAELEADTVLTCVDTFPPIGLITTRISLTLTQFWTFFVIFYIACTRMFFVVLQTHVNTRLADFLEGVSETSSVM
jgi:hypothetical protein